MKRAAAAAVFLLVLLGLAFYLNGKRRRLPQIRIPPPLPMPVPGARPSVPAPALPAARRAEEAAPTSAPATAPAPQSPRKPPAGKGVAADPVRVLEDILRTKNDNDPRLDTAFERLSEPDKARLREKYRSLPPEDRNGRGTVVYVLGRAPKTAEDWAFLRSVAAEPPCLSLASCSRPPAGGGDEHDAGLAVTLAYPSLVAVKSAQRAPRSEGARSVIAAGLASRSPAVARLAAANE